jgi:L-rhamnose isomerase/sugar isomerase
LIVDYAALSAAQQAGDVLGSHQVLVDAFQTDVRPLLRQVRREMDVPAEPLAALRTDAYVSRVRAERGSGSSSSSGYPGA